jgi:hypothetical protein
MVPFSMRVASSFTISHRPAAVAVYAFAWRYWVNAEEASAVA